MRVLLTIGLLGPFRDRYIRCLAVGRHDHVPMLVVAEDLGVRLLEAFERLGRVVAIGVVRADLADRYLGLEADQPPYRCQMLPAARRARGSCMLVPLRSRAYFLVASQELTCQMPTPKG